MKLDPQIPTRKCRGWLKTQFSVLKKPYEYSGVYYNWPYVEGPNHR
jgi:hypothetical protein